MTVNGRNRNQAQICARWRVHVRPQNWRGALPPHTTEVVFENLNPQKRPLTVTADFEEIVDVVSVTVREDRSTAVTLLFDPNHSLEERITAE